MRSSTAVSVPISSSFALTNRPALTFAFQKILGVNGGSSYLSLRLLDNKISIYSFGVVPFKLGDFIISKAIKK